MVGGCRAATTIFSAEHPGQPALIADVRTLTWKEQTGNYRSPGRCQRLIVVFEFAAGAAISWFAGPTNTLERSSTSRTTMRSSCREGRAGRWMRRRTGSSGRQPRTRGFRRRRTTTRRATTGRPRKHTPDTKRHDRGKRHAHECRVEPRADREPDATCAHRHRTDQPEHRGGEWDSASSPRRRHRSFPGRVRVFAWFHPSTMHDPPGLREAGTDGTFLPP